MTRRQPLYPHVPKSRKPGLGIPSPIQGVQLRFLPDSPEFLTLSVNNTGLRGRLDSVVRAAIKRANEVRR